MDDHALYARLLDVAEKLGVEVRLAPVEPPGGTCRLRGRLVVMVSRDATVVEKTDLLARSLAAQPGLDALFLLPEVRERLESLR
jgi:hypothetical protein